MSISFAIASWTIGSVVLGLLLGHILRASAKSSYAEENFIASLQTGRAEATRPA